MLAKYLTDLSPRKLHRAGICDRGSVPFVVLVFVVVTMRLLNAAPLHPIADIQHDDAGKNTAART